MRTTRKKASEEKAIPAHSGMLKNPPFFRFFLVTTKGQQICSLFFVRKSKKVSWRCGTSSLFCFVLVRMKGRMFVIPGTRYGFTVADTPPRPPPAAASAELMTEVMESKTIEKEAGKAAEWGLVRFVFTENLGGTTEELIQLSTVVLCNPATSESPGILTNRVDIKQVTNPNGSSPYLEEVTSLTSGAQNKWLDRNFRGHHVHAYKFRTRAHYVEFLSKYGQGEGFSVVDFEFLRRQQLKGYVFWAGNDAPSRDPVSWVVLGKQKKDDKQWTILDVRSNVNTPDRFQIYSFYTLNFGEWEKGGAEEMGLGLPPIEGGYLEPMDVCLYDSKDLVNHWKKFSPSLPEYQELSKKIAVQKEFMSFSLLSSCLSFVSSLMKSEDVEEGEGRLCAWKGGRERGKKIFEELIKNCICYAYGITSRMAPSALPLTTPLVRPMNLLSERQRKRAEAQSCQLHQILLFPHIMALYQSIQWRGPYLFLILRELRSLEEPGGMMGVLALLAKGGGECQVRRIDCFNIVLQRFCRLHIPKYGTNPSPAPRQRDYSMMTVAEMKKLLRQRLVDHSTAVEKQDLKDLLIQSTPNYGLGSSGRAYTAAAGAPQLCASASCPEISASLFLPPNAPTPPSSLLPSPSLSFVQGQQHLLSGLSEFLEGYKMKAFQTTFSEPSKLLFQLSHQNIPRDDVDIHGIQMYSGLVLATLGVQVAIETQQFDDVKGCVPFLEKRDIIQPYLDEIWKPENLGVPYTAAIRKVGTLPVDKIRRLRDVPSRGFIFPHNIVRKCINEANNPNLLSERQKVLPYLAQFVHYFDPSFVTEKLMLALLGEQKFRRSLDICFRVFRRGVLGIKGEEKGKEEAREGEDEEMKDQEEGERGEAKEKEKEEAREGEEECVIGKAEREGLQEAKLVEEWVYDIENGYIFSPKKAQWFLYFLGFLKHPEK